MKELASCLDRTFNDFKSCLISNNFGFNMIFKIGTYKKMSFLNILLRVIAIRIIKLVKAILLFGI